MSAYNKNQNNDPYNAPEYPSSSYIIDCCNKDITPIIDKPRYFTAEEAAALEALAQRREQQAKEVQALAQKQELLAQLLKHKPELDEALRRIKQAEVNVAIDEIRKSYGW